MQHVRSFFHPRSRDQNISADAKVLMVTILMWHLVNPILSAFSYAFLWRNTQSLVAVVIYALGFFIMLPVGFIITGLLLRRISLAHLYGMSMVLLSLVVFILMVFAPTSLMHILILGMIFGTAAGCYWGARNMLELSSTTNHNRNYFYGILVSLMSIVGVIAPMLIGWVLIQSPLAALFSIRAIYVGLSLFALATAVYIYGLTHKISFDVSRRVPIILHHPSHAWKYVRGFAFFEGVATGRHFYIPALMILYLVGNEEVLGVFESVAALILAIVIYMVGRYLPENKRLMLMGIGFIGYTIASIVFAMYFAYAGAIFYRTFMPIFLAFLWITVGPVRLEAIERLAKTKEMYFALLTDNEIFLNIGRVVGVGIFFALVYIRSEGFALQYVPLLMSFGFIGSFYYGYKIVRNVEK